MKARNTYLLFLFLLLGWIFAQQEKASSIHLTPNFDISTPTKDTLVSGKEYAFTLVGLDSARIGKVILGGMEGSCKVRKGDGNTALLYISPPVWFVTGEKQKGQVSKMKLDVYCRKDNSICFTTMLLNKVLPAKFR